MHCTCTATLTTVPVHAAAMPHSCCSTLLHAVRACVLMQALTVLPVPSVRFTQPVATVECSNVSAVLEVALSDGAFLTATGAVASVRIRLTDTAAAEVIGEDVVSWGGPASADEGSLETPRTFVVHLKSLPAGRVSATLEPMANVVVGDTGGIAELHVPAVTFSYMPNQVFRWTADATTDSVANLNVPIVVDGCTPFPAKAHYRTHIIALHGERDARVRIRIAVPLPPETSPPASSGICLGKKRTHGPHSPT